MQHGYGGMAWERVPEGMYARIWQNFRADNW
jgi:hypothetical protein